MSNKDASFSDGTSTVQYLELLSNLFRLVEWDLATVIPLGCLSCLCSALSQRWLEHQVWLHLLCGVISQSIICDWVGRNNVSP